IIEQEMDDPRTLVDAIPCGNQRLLVLVHETRPTLEHDDDVEVRPMIVPPGAFLWCKVGRHQLRKDCSGGSVRDPEVAVFEEVAQPFSFEFSVARLDV